MENKKKLQAILDYNATKGEVDSADEMLRTYSTKSSIPMMAPCGSLQFDGHHGFGHIHYMCGYIGINLFKM